jgi:hypothetical protein
MKLDARATEQSRKAEGAHYTPAGLAEFVAKHLAAICGVKEPAVLDPAVGDGELLVAFGKAWGRECFLNGFDLDEVAVANAEARLRRDLPLMAGEVKQQDFLEFALEHREDSLFSRPASNDLEITKQSQGHA